MSKITFTLEVEPEEVAEVVDACWDVVQDFGFPAYEIHTASGQTLTSRIGGGDRTVINLPPVKGASLGEDVDDFSKWVEAALPGWALDDEDEDEDEDETDPCIVLPGMVVELANGLVYQVFSVDATGRVVLDLLEESVPEDRETLH